VWGRCRPRPWSGRSLVVYEAGVLAAPRYPLPYLLNVNGGRHIARHVSNGGDPPFWFLLHHGAWLSKTAAGEWALREAGAPPIVAEALARRRAGSDADLDPAAVLAFTRTVG
jgi:hypothetical protein